MNNITFDDVLIRPRFSDIESRKDVSICSNFGGIKLSAPIILAPMDTVSGAKSCIAIHKFGGLGILHRFQSIDNQVGEFSVVKIYDAIAGAAIGLGDIDRVHALYKKGCNIFVIDVAHGHTKAVGEYIKQIRDYYKDTITIIAGSVATASGCHFLHESGADVIRVGIGAGAACTTRIKTGVGVPQLSAIIECVSTGIPIIADGGIRNPGDMCKALAAGASAVMCGRIFAGLEESPIPLKYRGMASFEVMAEYNKALGWRTAEGESYTVSPNGDMESVMSDFCSGLRSSMSYVGARTLKEFKNNKEFILVNSSVVKENGAHGK